jgi:NAD(P)-dependent dehydrogenase (short-subunit alcohol dehydrogenase family)
MARTAVVTGGAGGIGGAIVRALADTGLDVAVLDRSGEFAVDLGDEAAVRVDDVIRDPLPVRRQVECLPGAQPDDRDLPAGPSETASLDWVRRLVVRPEFME